MVTLNLGAFLSLPKYFTESNWTTKKQILWTIINVFFIGLGNYIFSVLIEVTTFTWKNLLIFESYTIAVAVFPITISILINQVRLNHKYVIQSEQLNENIKKKQNKYIADINSSIIAFEHGNEKFELSVEDFLFAKSDDNYVEIYYFKNAAVSRILLRNTLKSVYELLSDHKTIFKCHRSYIANLNHLQRIKGNAQGYSLHLKGVARPLPVSRTLNKTIKSYLADYL
jgi:hypothetical protein